MKSLDNKYIPTASEEKLLEVLANPEHFGKNVTERCRIAGLSRTVYYDAMQKQGFIDYYNKLMLDLVRGSVGDIIAATIKFGTKEKANSADRKMLLEMAGTYAPKLISELTGKDGGSLEVSFGISRPKRDKAKKQDSEDKPE